MDTMENLKARIIAKTHEAYDIFNTKMSREYSYPEITFDVRGTRAGLAYWWQNKIDFNLKLAYYNEVNFLKRTTFHEASHCLAAMYYGYDCGHDYNWKFVMRDVLGLDPSRCHNYDVSKCAVRRTYVYRYMCGCSVACLAGAKAHNAIQNGRIVSCCKCGVRLTPDRYVAKLDRHTLAVV